MPTAGARTRATAQALRDLRGLTRPNGAVAAGPDGPWAYAWPRDSAFVAAAYAETGHVADARRVLGFLSRVQRADGGFEARYRLDGSGPPDDRPRQSDGAGWVLWSLERVRAAGTGRTLPAELRALRDRAFGFVMAQTAAGTRLPEVSPDYWEVSEREVTLGTAAPLAAGLEAAAATYAAEGDARRADQASRAARGLRSLIRTQFGPGYQRHGHSGGLDAGVAMLMPPFAVSGRRRPPSVPGSATPSSPCARREAWPPASSGRATASRGRRRPRWSPTPPRPPVTPWSPSTG